MPKIEVNNLNLWFDTKHVLKDVNIEIYEKEITAIIGPSGCGKSTFLRCLNRMNDLIPSTRIEGEIKLDGKNIIADDIDPVDLRKDVGMVFQKPNPFPKSIYENIVFAPKIHGIEEVKKDPHTGKEKIVRRKPTKEELDQIVEKCLRRAALWEEVKDRLNKSAYDLSGGQQQRLCIARTMSIEPEVILFDEPCSALDPIATAKIEDLLVDLRKDYTVVIVTHNMQQAARVADRTAFFYMGDLVEYGPTKKLFEKPEKELTEQYLTGRMG
ncbi:phosphate ABC transporter ATP-binding protein PstB [Candidatus Methanomassiliicoccus intestinalis]|uniref:phosphate ABC transporter ATP-binding protein PstB n=1 Tax=Candidatus Methanomassiliicoccus intestinalis TaxID=1406512 RepID=UPI0037DC118B